MIAGYVFTWSGIASYLAGQPQSAILRVEKHQVQHPRDAGMRPSVGLTVGQSTDWRYKYPSCSGLHVRDFGTFYSAHLDRANPECDLLGHIVSDTPQIAGGLALGALLGLALGKSKEAALVGAMFGGLIGLATTSSAAEAGMKKPSR